MLLYLFMILVLFSPNEYKAPVPVKLGQSEQKVSCAVFAVTGPKSAVIYSLEEAISPEQKLQGLMFRKQLPEKGGMIFYSNEPKIAKMWMKNTYIPLDMLFISDKGEVVCIKENTVPLSEDTISCDKPVKFVVELNAGQVKAQKIATGDLCMIIPNMKELTYSEETGCSQLE